MNFIDIVIAIPLLWAIYKGFTKGLIIELASFIGFWVGIWGSIRFSDYLVPLLREHFQLKSTYLPILAFFLTFLMIILLVYLIAKLIQKAVEGMALGILNKCGGAMFSFFKYALLISVFIYVIDGIQKDYPLLSASQKKESVLYTPIGKIAPLIIPKLKEWDWKRWKDPFPSLEKTEIDLF
jgi:membrane protein required for colicin V production